MLAITVLFIVSVYVFVKVLFQLVAPFFIGWLLAQLFEPIVSRLAARLKMHRGLLALLCVLIVLVVIATAGTLITIRIVNEAHALAESLPQQSEALMIGIDNIREEYLTITERIPEELRSATDEFISSLSMAFTSGFGESVRKISGSAVRVVPGAAIGVLLCFISMFFFIKDHDLINKTIVSKIPAALTEKYIAVKKGLINALVGYIRAQAILMSITACIALGGLIVLGYPYALFLGLVIAMFDALPVFGPGFILWPWAVATAIGGDYRFAIGLMIVYTLIIIARQTSEPKVLGSQIGVHPLVTLMSMFIGLQVFGVLGFLIGPFIVICLKAIFMTGDENYFTKDN